jgi:dihydroorotase
MDRHCHFRDGDTAKLVLPFTAAQQATRAIAMGNLGAPHYTHTPDKAFAYGSRLKGWLPAGSDLQPLPVCFLTDETTADQVLRGFIEGAWHAVKVMMTLPKSEQGTGGGSTNAHLGVTDFVGRYDIFRTCQEHGIPVLLHVECVEKWVNEDDREFAALHRFVIPLRQAFPGLIIVFEHVSDGRSAIYVAKAHERGEPTFATVTPQVLLANRDSIFWGGLTPTHYCRPVLKGERDQMTITLFVVSGHPAFGYGTDSAPWDSLSKSKMVGNCAGIMSSLCAVELAVIPFERFGRLGDDAFERFMSVNLLKEVYRVTPSSQKMHLVREPRAIPLTVDREDGVKFPVYFGGTTLDWTLWPQAA